MKRFIAIDSGKHETKVAVYDVATDTVLTRRFRTRTGIGTFEDDNPGRDTFLMEFEGKTYRIGRNADADAELQTTKKTLTHKLCTLYAIASICSENEVDEVYAAIGIPVKDYENVENRNDYREYILPQGEITVKYKNSGEGPIITKTFKIVERQVHPETLGAIFAVDGIDMTGSVAVIDMGHLNVNQTIYNGGEPDKEYSMTDTLGGNALVTGLSQKLSSLYSFINEKQTADILLNTGDDRCLKPRKENKEVEISSKAIIDEYLLNHVQKIMNHCEAGQWSVDYLDFVFIGGTSFLLREEIKKIFGAHVVMPDDPVLANTLGFLRILCGRNLNKKIDIKNTKKM